MSLHPGNSDVNKGNGLLSDVQNPGVGSLFTNQPEVEISSSGTDTYDMFADDDEHAVPSSNENLAADANGVNQQTPSNLNPNSESMRFHPLQMVKFHLILPIINLLIDFSRFKFVWHAGGASQNDYVYDELSGYFISLHNYGFRLT